MSQDRDELKQGLLQFFPNKSRIPAEKLRDYLTILIDSLVLQTDTVGKNYIKVSTGYTLVGNILTINAGWFWVIDGEEYTNNIPIEIIIPTITEGYFRIDMLVVNTESTFVLKQGIPSTTNPIAPLCEEGELPATLIFIDSNEPIISEPILGQPYIKKEFDQIQVIYPRGLEGVDMVPRLNKLGKRVLLLQGNIINIKGLDLSMIYADPTAEIPHEGKLITFINNTGHDVILNHTNHDIGYEHDLNFVFENGQDRVIPNNKRITFMQRSGIILEEDIRNWSTMEDVIGLEEYLDQLVLGLWDDRGPYDASVNEYPISGGSGTGGQIKKGDIWTIIEPGTLGSIRVTEGWTVRALTDDPEQTEENWALQSSGLTSKPLTVNTYFVNTVTGNNATGLYQDPTKPFADIDYVFALPTWKDGDMIYLQNHQGTFPMNTVFPKGTTKILSDFKVTLDFSANNNSSVVNSDSEIYSYIHLLIPNGIIKNDRSGGTGCVFMEDNYKLFMEVKAKELYYDTSTDFAKPSGYDIYIPKISVKSRLLEINWIPFSYQLKPIYINEFTCLGTGARLVNNLPMGIPITINKINGPGSFYFSSAYYNIGDIETTEQSLCADNGNPIVLNFKNSTISTATGLELCNYYGGSVVITGIVKSATKINFLVSEGANNNLRVVNFSGDIGKGQLRAAQGAIWGITIENSFIKSLNSPLAYYTGFGASGIVIRNSAFETVNSVPLVTGGTGDTRTLKISGVSTSSNITMLSDAAGTGVTITSEVIHGEIKLPNYTSSRNDGANPNNKTLNVDASGNVKLYTMPVLPPPYLEELIPDSYLPETTGNFRILGSFFTPTTTVIVEGQTLNYLTFISDNEMLANITTGATEGTFDITINNGISVVFADTLLVILGRVYKPSLSHGDWIDIQEPIDLDTEGEVKVELYDSFGSATINQANIVINSSIDYRFVWNHENTPFEELPNVVWTTMVTFYRVTDNEPVYRTMLYVTGGTYAGAPNHYAALQFFEGVGLETNTMNDISTGAVKAWNRTMRLQKVGGVMAFYIGNTLFRTPTYIETENMYVKFETKKIDFLNIKYIELI